MKIRLLLLLIIPYITFSQVTTTPSIPITTSSIKLTLNTTGTELEGITGDIYAHTGVTIDNTRWQNVIAEWGVNTPKAKLTKSTTNSNIYTIDITPDVYSFYNVESSKKITEICVVFRSADGTKQTRPDIFIPLYEAGLNVAFTSLSN